MKALTICNPYPNLFFLPPSDRRIKRVENRQVHFSHTGPLLIHAGKSRAWLRGNNYGIKESQMVWGAIVGIVECVGCFKAPGGRPEPAAISRWPWVDRHEHVWGPWCLVFENPRMFPLAIPYRGQQGLFDIPDDVIARAIVEATV